MISQQEAEARVAKGAAHLDQVRPGWHERIDVGALTLHDPCGCIVGQLCGTRQHFNLGRDALDLTGGAIGTAVMYGFDANMRDTDFESSCDEVFALLQDAWIAEIARRRFPDRIETPEQTTATVRQ